MGAVRPVAGRSQPVILNGGFKGKIAYRLGRGGSTGGGREADIGGIGAQDRRKIDRITGRVNRPVGEISQRLGEDTAVVGKDGLNLVAVLECSRRSITPDATV